MKQLIGFATRPCKAFLTRKDTIVVASVSCIYNLGSPEDYQKVMLTIVKGQTISRGKLFASLVNLQYQRNDFDFQPGCFRTRGEQIQVYSPTGKQVFYFTIIKNKVETKFLSVLRLTSNRAP